VGLDRGRQSEAAHWTYLQAGRRGTSPPRSGRPKDNRQDPAGSLKNRRNRSGIIVIARNRRNRNGIAAESDVTAVYKRDGKLLRIAPGPFQDVSNTFSAEPIPLRFRAIPCDSGDLSNPL